MASCGHSGSTLSYPEKFMQKQPLTLIYQALEAIVL
jgi:hypothetical protein